MQATFDSRTYETFNHSWHTASRENPTRSSFNASNPFDRLNSAFGPALQRSIDPFAASRAFIQPAVYQQMSRGMGSSFSPYEPSAQRARYGQGGTQLASTTNFSREVMRTPDGGMMSKTSFTRIEQPASQRNRVPDTNRCDTNRRGYDDRCWDNKSDRAPHQDMSVTSKGDDLKVNMGKGTTLETKKSDSDLFLNTQVGNDKISIDSTGDPHLKVRVNGQEVLKGDYHQDLGLNINGTKYLMSPEQKKSNNGPAPYLSSTYVQQRDGSMYKLDHLSQTDKTSKPTFSEITDPSEKAAVKARMDSAHTLTYDKGNFIDSTTGKKATNEDINKH
jgi:hypothetical protein